MSQDDSTPIPPLTDIKHELYHGHDKTELTRLIVQSLTEMGYESSAKLLQTESNIEIDPPVVLNFTKSVKEGEWDEVETLLESLELQPNTDKNHLLFLIRRQKYLELLIKNDKSSALKVLRYELSTLSNINIEKLHKLSSLIMCDSLDDLKSESKLLSSILTKKLDDNNNTGSLNLKEIDIAILNDRNLLLSTLQKFVSPNIMLPEHRLSILLDEAKNYQKLRALWLLDNKNNSEISLYKDYQGDKDKFPQKTIKILVDHTDEVWFVKFSNNGKYLASTSQDTTVKIYDTEDDFKLITTLRGHDKPVICVSWSSDDSYMLSTGCRGIFIWNPITGDCIKKIETEDPITTVGWIPNSTQFLTGSSAKKIDLWDINGNSLYQWSSLRVQELSVCPNSLKFVTICNEGIIDIYDLKNHELLKEIHLNKKITSIRITKDSKFILINVGSNELHIWDIENYYLVSKFFGNKQEKYIIRSCFGGLNDSIVASGSEDTRIYIWNRKFGVLIQALSGHTSQVNCVDWNPTNPSMLASASDDKTVRIWGP